MSQKLVTCKECGWVHVLLTRKEAEESIDEFNKFFDYLPEEKQQEWYGGRRASLDPYIRCFHCGSGRGMRWFKEGDCPDGVTLQSTILVPFL